jgi:DNA-binding CsgD family transcriptional regulator
VLIGREGERARIDRMLEGAGGGRSAALVVRGEAGIGKTALLEYAIERAGEATVVRAVGVETESEFAYSGLHELVRPLLGRLDQLPEIQADALRGALALAPAGSAGRLSIGAATLSLLAAAAGDGPLLCVVDDAQWLDAATAAALVFAARRLEAEGLVMLFAARGDGFRAPGLDELELAGLDEAAAVALLDEQSGSIERGVAAGLAAATGGNPLALRELAGLLTPAQLRGAEPLPHPLPVGPRLETIYAATARSLSDDARRALVIAATADTRSMRVLGRTNGATLDGLEECEASGLLTIGEGAVSFTHPLVRSAVYHQATPPERRAAHRALAAGLAGERKYAERSAWHAAAAAVEPDEAVAAGLEQAGAAASERRAHVAAAGMLERAARLTPDDGEAARRLYLAARSARLAGQSERALRLLDDADAAAPLLAADVVHLRARLTRASSEELAAEAARVEPLDPVRASTLLATAAEAAPAETGVELARRAVALAGADEGVRVHAELVLAGALLDAGDAIESQDLLASARSALAGNRALRHDPELILLAVETLARVDAGDDALTRELLEDVIAAARAHAVLVLPRALVLSGWRHFEAGSWTDASLDFFEAARLAAELGRPRERAAALVGSALLAALRGRLDAATVAELEPAAAAHVLGLAALGAGDVEGAIAHLEAAQSTRRPRGVPGPRLDLVEALLRAGRRPEAEAAAGAVDAADAAWANALLGDGAAHGAALQEAAERPFAEARLRLVRGEELRRAGARREARVELDAALAVFERLDAEPWSERARRELKASGATVGPRERSTLDELTPQELQIARLVAAGASQKEAAAALYLSPKTIEYHLGKVYRKLGITSGRKLRDRLEERELLEAP